MRLIAAMMQMPSGAALKKMAPDTPGRNWKALMTEPGAGQKFMVGLLLSGETQLVAASGKNNSKLQFLAQSMGLILCPEITSTTEHLSCVGRVIAPAEYEATQAIGGPTPGNCAAPRLIEHAFTLPNVRANMANWEMSEIYYQPNTKRRTKDDLYWEHGLSAHHCDTCDALVPLLMCP
jgi:hypothetical protein